MFLMLAVIGIGCGDVVVISGPCLLVLFLNIFFFDFDVVGRTLGMLLTVAIGELGRW